MGAGSSWVGSFFLLWLESKKEKRGYLFLVFLFFVWPVWGGAGSGLSSFFFGGGGGGGAFGVFFKGGKEGVGKGGSWPPMELPGLHDILRPEYSCMVFWPSFLTQSHFLHAILQRKGWVEHKWKSSVDFHKLRKVYQAIIIDIKHRDRVLKVPRKHRCGVVHDLAQFQELLLVDCTTFVLIKKVKAEFKDILLCVHAIRDEHLNILFEINASTAISINEGKQGIREW
eukprot:FR740155.1.p1 GENE.FR740155.1~~FR740155.1.p1  ORF type:complete len:227 (-),score=59.99 FR740155.1:68-748(-)